MPYTTVMLMYCIGFLTIKSSKKLTRYYVISLISYYNTATLTIIILLLLATLLTAPATLTTEDFRNFHHVANAATIHMMIRSKTYSNSNMYQIVHVAKRCKIKLFSTPSFSTVLSRLVRLFGVKKRWKIKGHIIFHPPRLVVHGSTPTERTTH